MPVYRYIDDFTAGNSYTLIRSIDPLESDSPLSDAWFTVKTTAADSDETALIDMHITVSGSVNGYLNVYADGSAKMTFTITPTLTELLLPSQTYYYDICIRAESAEVHTVEEGKLLTTRYIRQLIA